MPTIVSIKGVGKTYTNDFVALKSVDLDIERGEIFALLGPKAELMADRIGVINKGELVVVEEKKKLMQRLGKRQLQIVVRQPLEKLPAELAEHQVELSEGGTLLTYTFDVQNAETGIAPLLALLGTLGIELKDLRSKESSLEDIFVNLVHGAAS